jgi:enoyl-CoA hydratase/carnithine racemase
MAELVSYEQDGDVALIGLNRPDKRNAMSKALVEALAAAVECASRQARAAVLFGHGKHFCAGLDLAEHAERTQIEGIENSRRWHAVFDRIQRGVIPFVCALHGAVVGGGFELAAATHVRVAASDAVFALPEGQRGIFVGGSGSVRIARLIGLANMTDLMLTGRVLAAAEAFRMNAVQYEVGAGEARDKALALARKAASNAPLANFAILNALPRIQDMAQDDGLFVESLISSLTSSGEEAHKRLRDFLEGRAERLVPRDGAK